MLVAISYIFLVTVSGFAFFHLSSHLYPFPVSSAWIFSVIFLIPFVECAHTISVFFSISWMWSISLLTLSSYNTLVFIRKSIFKTNNVSLSFATIQHYFTVLLYYKDVLFCYLYCYSCPIVWNLFPSLYFICCVHICIFLFVILAYICILFSLYFFFHASNASSRYILNKVGDTHQPWPLVV